MIKHIVLFKSNGKHAGDNLIEQLNLLKDIPFIQNLEFGKVILNRSQEFEVGLCLNLADENMLVEYRKHPKHVELVKFLKNQGIEFFSTNYLIKE